MPGVPSGKGCNACRKQKKKCDQANPCSRCARLNVKCVGAGQQRYVFRTPTKPTKSSRPRLSAPTSAYAGTNGQMINPAHNLPGVALGNSTPVARLSCTLSNTDDKLLNVFFYAIQPSMDIRFNLGWTYGAFLYEVPQRLGTSKPLDTAVQALVSAHGETCRGFRKVSPETLLRYSDALKALRTCLDDPVEALRSETLCAVSILLICQSLLGVSHSNTPTHAEGAARIIQARGCCYNLTDKLERKLLLTLRGSLLLDGIFNEKMTEMFTSEQWQRLASNELDGSSSEGEMMRCVAQMPDIIRRGRRMRKSGDFDDKILKQCHFGYQTIKTISSSVQIAYEDFNRSHVMDSNTSVSLHAYYHRLCAATMTFTLVSNMLLQAALTYNTKSSRMSMDHAQQHFTSSLDIEVLVHEARQYSATIYELAAQANQYRPLGGAYMLMCLIGAWIGIDDHSRQKAIHLVIDDYQGDYARTGLKITESTLDWMKKRIQFEDVPSHAPNG